MSVLSPVRVSEVLPAVKDVLDVASMQAILGGTGRVLVATGNSIVTPFPDVDSVGYSARIVLMLRNDAPMEHLDMTVPVYFNVRVDVKAQGEGAVNIKCDYIQTQIYALLQNTSLSLSYSTQLFKTWRKNQSHQIRYDEEGWYYNTSKWQTILTPNA